MSTKPPLVGCTAPVATASQWRLMANRFRRHRLAWWCGVFLIVLYGVALFAPVVAPYPQSWRETRYSFAPPMPVRWSPSQGLHARAIVVDIDPVTLQRRYALDPGRVLPLAFMAVGEPYHLFGIFRLERRILGVDLRYCRAQGWAQEDCRWYPLGADRFGQDIFSRLVHGSRVSLSIGLVAIAINFILGLSVGGASGYFGGWFDNLAQRGIEIINSFPQIPLWLAMAAVIPTHWSALQTYFTITLLLSLLTWTGLARVVRGKVLSLREEDYAMAARISGAGHGRIIFRHLLPGFTSHVIVAVTLSVPHMIIGETALSFLGLGLRPPVISWGVMLQDCLNLQVVAAYPWLMMPVFGICSTVLAFNFLGDGLRDAADPYGR